MRPSIGTDRRNRRGEARGALTEASKEVERLRDDLERERIGGEKARGEAAELRALLDTVTEQRDESRTVVQQAQVQESRQAAAVADAERCAAQDQVKALRADLAAAWESPQRATAAHQAEVQATREQAWSDRRLFRSA